MDRMRDLVLWLVGAALPLASLAWYPVPVAVVQAALFAGALVGAVDAFMPRQPDDDTPIDLRAVGMYLAMSVLAPFVIVGDGPRWLPYAQLAGLVVAGRLLCGGVLVQLRRRVF